jgi:uncharacterized protein YegP (UPF0339 family)
MEAKYVINNRMNGDLYFVLKAPNGQVIATSEDYANIAAVNNAIESVRKYAATQIIEPENV